MSLSLLTLLLLSANLVVSGFVLWMLSVHLSRLEHLEQALLRWTTPEALAKPLPVPGTMFVVDDREAASRERLLRAESRQRGAAMEATRRVTRR